jgi:hypothetical protein
MAEIRCESLERRKHDVALLHHIRLRGQLLQHEWPSPFILAARHRLDTPGP